MNAEQKQRAAQMLRRFSQANPRTLSADNAAVDMAALLQELIDAPEPEPVAYQVRNGWVNVAIYQRQIDAENYAKDQQKRHDLSGSLAHFCVVPLYTTPPSPTGYKVAAEPDWLDTTRFLTDVTTAAGLLGHGRQDKGLARRIGDFAHKYRMLAAAPAAQEQDGVARDAERYRWLKCERFDKPYAVTNENMTAVYEGDELDSAIDAAIAAEKGGA